MAIWKLGTTSDLFDDILTEEEAIAEYAAIGFETLDYGVFGHQGKNGRFWGKDYLDQAKSISEAAQKAGISFSQAHAPMFDLLAPNGEQLLELTRRSFEIAQILGAPYLVIHPQFLPGASSSRMYEEELKHNLAFYASLLDISAKTGVKIALENMFGHDPETKKLCPVYFSYMEDILEYLDLTEGKEQFVVCLDTGHANIIGKDSISDCIRKLDSHLKLLHIHDNYGDADNHMPPYHGNIDWKDTVLALKEIGYTGALSLEAQQICWRYPKNLAIRRKAAELSFASLKYISAY